MFSPGKRFPERIWLFGALSFLLIFGLLLLYSLSSLHSKKDDTSTSIITYDLEYFLDAGGGFKFEDVSREGNQTFFSKNSEGRLGWGLTSSVLWIKYKFHPEVMDSENYVLEIGNPLLDHIEFYSVQKNKIFRYTTGDRLPFSNRPLNTDTFVFPVTAGSTIYLRIQSEGSMFVPLSIFSYETYHENVQIRNIFLGIYYGGAAALLLYNLFLFLSLRDKNYLYYILWILAFGMMQTVWNGLSYHYFWPNSPHWTDFSGIFFAMTSMFFGMQFGISFLEIKKWFPRFYRGYMLFALGMACLLFLDIFLPHKVGVVSANVVSFIIIPAALSLSFMRIRQGFRPAKFYLAAWLLMFAGILLVNLQNTVYVFSSFIMLYGYQVTSFLEMILLSFALADKIRLMQHSVIEADRKLISQERLTIEVIEASRNRLERLVEERTREFQEEKEKAQEAIKGKDKFISLVSHDLKSPLLGILSLMDMIGEDPSKSPLPKEQRIRLFTQLQDSTRGLLEMIDQLLNIGRLKTGKIRLLPEKFDLNSVVDEAMLLLSGFADDKNVVLNNEISQDVIVTADRILIKELIQNLISNGIKFTDSGGSVNVSMSGERKGWISVRDTGRGFPEGQIESIKKGRSITSLGTASERGSGLGLLFCLDILDQHQGNLEIKSVEGEGSEFFVFLPEFNHPLLLVDDQDDMRKTLKGYLKDTKYNVVEAMDGLHALEILEKIKPELIVTDIHMPEMGGFELVKRIRQSSEQQNIPVIVMTSGPALSAMGDSGIKEIAMQLGADGFFTKPVSRKEFLSHIEKINKIIENSR